MARPGPHHLLPLPTPYQSLSASARTRKRKNRNGEQGTFEDELHNVTLADVEYSAVINPEERLQRRLAGQPLNDPPPPLPFPHARLPETPPSSSSSFPNVSTALLHPIEQSTSLRLQHLSAITTVLHRCLELKDHKRASRALALILRTEIHGKSIDIRHAGLWGVAAEILLRTPTSGEAGCISRESFNLAKTFYDKMAIQYPWHRTWPNVINAQDFKIAMFGLWIYVTCQESKRLHDGVPGIDASDYELHAKRYELAEAGRIAREMDTSMSTVPFIDDLELIRMRAMVALWIADLLEKVDTLEVELESNNSMHEQDMEKVWLRENQATDEIDTSLKPINHQALNARNLASTLFTKLGIDHNGGSMDVDENIDNGADIPH